MEQKQLIWELKLDFFQETLFLEENKYILKMINMVLLYLLIQQVMIHLLFV